MAISVGDAVIELKLVKTEFEEGFRKIGAEVDKSTREMRRGMLNVGAAITAVSGFGLLFIDRARKMNAALGDISITTGVAKGELRDLALSLSDASFGINSVIDTISILTRAGITNKDQLKESAQAFDNLGDAIGMPAEAVAEMLIPAYKAFGTEIPRTASDTDKFTWLVKNSMVNLQDFASAMDYVAMHGQDLGLTLDDMISILAILEDRGITGSAAVRALRTAVTEATTEGRSLNDVLGITSQDLVTYNEMIGTQAVGATKNYADAAQEQFGIMDKLKSAWEDMTLRMGTFLEPAEPILGFLSTAGILMMALSKIHIKDLITGLGSLASSFIKLVGPAMRAVGALIAQAAASIWAAHGILPFIGVGLAIAGVAALLISIRQAKSDAAEMAALAGGGIVTRPTRALIGEAGPEAVIPLSKGGFGTREVHLHIGNYMGDEMSMRQLVRRIDQVLKEEGRRSAFGMNQGWYYGRSSL